MAGETRAFKSSDWDLALVRYNADGTLDASFGTGGKVTTHYGTSLDSHWNPHTVNVAISPIGGKIVVGATATQTGTVIVRYNANGTLDTGFGSTHTGSVNLGTRLSNPAVAVQPDDRIVVVGNVINPQDGQGDFGLDRLNPDGSPDASFGTGGMVVTALPSGQYAQTVILQPFGKIVVGGNWHDPFVRGADALMVTRYNSNGSLDMSFGVNGLAKAAAGSSTDSVSSEGLAVEPDGRIIIAGTSANSITDGFSLARFLATGPQIGSFTASPNPVTSGSGVTLTAADVQAMNPGSTIARVAFYVDSNADGRLNPATDALLGYGGQTIMGTWSLTFSAAGLVAVEYSFFAVAVDSLGVFSDPFAITATLN